MSSDFALLPEAFQEENHKDMMKGIYVIMHLVGLPIQALRSLRMSVKLLVEPN